MVPTADGVAASRPKRASLLPSVPPPRVHAVSSRFIPSSPLNEEDFVVRAEVLFLHRHAFAASPLSVMPLRPSCCNRHSSFITMKYLPSEDEFRREVCTGRQPVRRSSNVTAPCKCTCGILRSSCARAYDLCGIRCREDCRRAGCAD